jgi:receptor protein-tyrosine kinase
MSLREYIERGRRWVWLLVLAPFAGAAAAFMVSLQIDPTYASTAQITVNQVQDAAGPTYNSVLGNQSLTTTYARLVTSSLNLEGAARRLPAGALDKDRISAEPIRDTFLIEVTARDGDPERAAMVANAVANAFPDFIREVQLAGDSGDGRPLNTVFISEPAIAEEEAISPNRRVNTLLGAVLALVLAVGGIAFIEYLDDRVRSREDIERLGSPFLGGIVRFSRPGRRWLPRIGMNEAEVAEHTFVENFRNAGANLAFGLSANPRKIILVTSSTQGEGKTTVATNLAVALSRLSHKTSLIDGDLRRPAVHRSFRLPNSSGLTTAIVAVGAAPLSMVVHVSESLAVMTSGPVPPNPGEVLASQRLTSILEQLSAEFDVVIVDCPPMAGIGDTALWFGRADGVILVLAHGNSHSRSLKRSLADVTGRGTPLLGTVLNFIPEDEQAAYGYEYSYGHSEGRRRRSRLPSLVRPWTWWRQSPRSARSEPPITPPGLGTSRRAEGRADRQ